MKLKTEKAMINHQKDDKKAETIVTAVNQKTDRQPYVPLGSIEIIMSVPI